MLNELLNKAFKTSNKYYDHGKDNIRLCQKYFTDLTKDNDDITLRVYLYFFPATSLMEKNSEEFWFTKYKEEKNTMNMILPLISWQITSNISQIKISKNFRRK